MNKIDQIVSFWFGDLNAEGMPTQEVQKRWWVKDSDFDAEIKQRFGEDIIAATNGHYTDWLETPRGNLALILLIDQFCRNVYRNTAEAFAHDALCRIWAEHALQHDHDQALQPIERAFVYLPFEHAEDRELQAKSVELYAALQASVSSELEKSFAGLKDYAIAHQKIIDRFGRFPHRNKILGRESTTEEIQFLTEPGSSF